MPALPVPLAVRLTTSRAGSRHVTADVSDLQLRSRAPGGFASATMSLNRRLADIIDPAEIVPYGPITVYDRNTGEVAFDGRLDDPGRGDTWDITATGPAGHATDDTRAVVYIDRRLDQWVPTDSTPNALYDPNDKVPSSVNFDDYFAIKLSFPAGARVQVNSRSSVGYPHLVTAGQPLAMVGVNMFQGISNAGLTTWRTRIYSRTGRLGAATAIYDKDWTTVGQGGQQIEVVNPAHFWAEARIQYLGAAATVSDADVTFVEFENLVILGTRLDASGAVILATATATDPGTGVAWGLYSTTNGPMPWEVVDDLLGRMLPDFDGPAADVDRVYPYDSNGPWCLQLAYVDGANAEQILSDLMVVQPSHYWAAWQRTTSGRYFFEWTPWPTQVRYVASAKGLQTAGGSADLRNQVRVRYVDRVGIPRLYTKTQAVPALTAQALTRTGFVDLGSDYLTSAISAADSYLAEHAQPIAGDRISITEPVWDRLLQRHVQPWMIRPPALILLTDAAHPAGVPTAVDGNNVWLISETEYTASRNACDVTLGSYAPETEAALRRLRGRPLSDQVAAMLTQSTRTRRT